MLMKINEARRLANLKSLCISDQLTLSAQIYADKQAAMNMGGHFVGGERLRQRVVGIKHVGENLFEGHGMTGAAEPAVAITEIMGDCNQRALVLDPLFTHVGIGRAATTDGNDQPYYYWVQIFAQLNEPCTVENRFGVKPPTVAEYMAPPQTITMVKRKMVRPMIPGADGVEKVERVQRTYLDTIPRVVDGSSSPSKVVIEPKLVPAKVAVDDPSVSDTEMIVPLGERKVIKSKTIVGQGNVDVDTTVIAQNDNGDGKVIY